MFTILHHLLLVLPFFPLVFLTTAEVSPLPTPISLSKIKYSMKFAVNASLQNQYPSGQAKCDYHLLHGQWYDYEQIWHTGQLASGLIAAHQTLKLSTATSIKIMEAAMSAGNWWTSQSCNKTASPIKYLVQSIDRHEEDYGCITDACGPTEDLTDVSDGSHAMFVLTNVTGKSIYADTATNSAKWQLDHMSVPNHPGLYYNIINTTTGLPFKNLTDNVVGAGNTTLDQVSRSNIEGSLFLDACLYSGINTINGQLFCNAFIEQADLTVKRQDAHGLWLQWTPNDITTGRFHPRFNTWYALSLLDAADWINDKAKESIYEKAATLTGRTMALTQQKSGTIYYWNSFSNDGSIVTIKNAPCGSAVAVALQLWLRLYKRGYNEFGINIIRAVNWLVANQYNENHIDINLAGSYFELGFRKLAKWESYNTLDVVQRDLATNTGLQGLAAYVNFCSVDQNSTITKNIIC
jgi:hypothetical protein